MEGTKIHLLVVNPFIADLDLELTPKERDSLSKRMKAMCEDALKKAQSVLVQNGVKPKTTNLSSSISVADEICRIARDEAFDLIVVGSRGLTGVSRFLTGGVADKVIDHAPCSVMVVRMPVE